MAKKMYIWLDGKARQVKKAYIGVSNVARKIKKIYIGVNGVARCVFSGGEPSYYGNTASGLRAWAQNTAATSVGGYALFGGGHRSDIDEIKKIVTSYDESLTRGAVDNLSISSTYLAATSVGDYALFGGGIYSFGDEYDHSAWQVTAYDSALTKSVPESLDGGRSRLAATSVGDYALFGGGCYDPNSETMDTVDAYDKSLTKNVNVSPLSHARRNLQATTVGGYALFPYGIDDSDDGNPASIETYNTSLTRSLMECPIWRYSFAATSVGNYALIGGGFAANDSGGGSSTNLVHAINKSLTLSTPTPMTRNRYNFAAASVNGYAFFGGGYWSNGGGYTDVYDESLTLINLEGLEYEREHVSATSVGNYVLFANPASNAATVDVYQVI